MKTPQAPVGACLLTLLGWLLFVPPAAGTPEEGHAVSSFGVRLEQSGATGAEDLDLLFSERAKWALSGTLPGQPLLVFNGRFVAETANSLESARLRSLGVRLEIEGADLGVELGRQPVQYGGARLVDGLQVLQGFPRGLALGAWAGAAPDLFTTAPTPRLGGGPILAFRGAQDQQVSLAGEVLWAPSGLDRAGALILGQKGWGTRAVVHSRLDMQLVDSTGKVGLVDAAIFGRLHPTPSTRLDAFYDAYSSWRYLSTADLDPAIRRFDARSDSLGLSEDIPQDTLDDSLHQLFGLSGRWEMDAQPGDAHPRIEVDFRGRYHPDKSNRYTRLTPTIALEEFASGHAGLDLDVSFMVARGMTQREAGITTWFEPGAQRRLLLDASIRLLLGTPETGSGLGGYSDLFVDWVTERGVVLSGGVHGVMERDEDFLDTGYGLVARVSWHIRPGAARP